MYLVNQEETVCVYMFVCAQFLGFLTRRSENSHWGLLPTLRCPGHVFFQIGVLIAAPGHIFNSNIYLLYVLYPTILGTCVSSENRDSVTFTSNRKNVVLLSSFNDD